LLRPCSCNTLFGSMQRAEDPSILSCIRCFSAPCSGQHPLQYLLLMPNVLQHLVVLRGAHIRDIGLGWRRRPHRHVQQVVSPEVCNGPYQLEC
jgi:hypothetical protein